MHSHHLVAHEPIRSITYTLANLSINSLSIVLNSLTNTERIMHHRS
jgi:hypothetical protein